MICKFKLLKFQFEIEGGTLTKTAISTDTPEGKEEARRYLVQRIVQEKGDPKNIYLVGVSDLGHLDIITPTVEKILDDYFNAQRKQKPDSTETPGWPRESRDAGCNVRK